MNGLGFHSTGGRPRQIRRIVSECGADIEPPAIRLSSRLLCDCAEIITIMQVGAHQSYEL